MGVQPSRKDEETGRCTQRFCRSRRRSWQLGEKFLRPRRRFTADPPRPPRNEALNENIRAARVRLIGEDGSQLGIKTKDEALDIARDHDLDLVVVAQQADPPVARIMDHGKYRYEQEQKAKLARKHQSQVNVKEIKFRPKIGIHDYNTKKGHVERFLNQRAKVKVTIMFRGSRDDASGAWAGPADAAGGGRQGDRPGRAAAASRRTQHDDAARAHEKRGSDENRCRRSRDRAQRRSGSR